MFKKLYLNIYLPIFLIAVTLILFIDVISAIMITQTLKDAYNDIDQKRVSRALDSCELYISSVISSAYNLSLDKDIINELTSPSGNTLVNKLDNTCNYSLKIDAVCAYSAKGTIYTSSQVSNVPTFAELNKVNEIKKFIEGDESETISLRTEYIADLYNSAFYPDKMGVVTYCRKVYNEDSVVGWIFADILPVNLYNYLFANGQFKNAVAFITFNDSFFDYNDNTSKQSLLTVPNGDYFKYQAKADDELFSITVFNSKQEYRKQLTILVAILFSVSFVLIIGVHFAARLIAGNVTKRLDNLIDKMNSQEIK